MPKASNSWKGSGKGGSTSGGGQKGAPQSGDSSYNNAGGSWNKKWTVKSDDKEGAAQAAKSDAPAVPLPKPEVSDTLTSSADGPVYGKLQLLHCYVVIKKMGGDVKVDKKAPLKADEAEAFGPTVSLTERDENEDGNDGGKTPPRKGKAGQKKGDKFGRKAVTSGIFIDDPGDGTPKAPDTPSQKISLSKELPLESANAPPFSPMASMTTPTSSMANQPSMSSPEMAWLFNSMYNPASMSSMYSGQRFTTVMLRNIPNRYTRDMLIDRLNENYRDNFDFVYLPIDFNSKCNVGYAFINFRLPVHATRFVQEFHGHKTKLVLPGFSSSKVCEVTYARVQGRDANMENLRDEKFIEKLNERPEWQPLFLDSRGKEIPFAKTLGVVKKKGRSNPAGTSAMMQAPTMGMPMPPYPYAYGMSPYSYPGMGYGMPLAGYPAGGMKGGYPTW